MRRVGRPNQLTSRERDVLELIRLGLTNEEIAGRLGITLDGAKYHVSQILSKLGVSTREEAAAASLALGERRAWWAAWPLWAKIAGAATMVAAVAGLAVLAAAMLLGSSTEEEPDEGLGSVPGVPDGLVADALEAMEALESYHFDVTFSAPPNYLETTERWEVDFVAPSQFRIVIVHKQGTMKEICESFEDERGSGEICHNAGLETVTGTVTTEGVWSDDLVYVRECGANLSDCQPWTRHEANIWLTPVTGPAWMSWHPSALFALRMSERAQIVGTETIEGESLVRISARFNPARALIETETLVLGDERLGPGVECGVEGTVELGEEPPEPQGTCREVPYDPFEAMAQEIARYDEDPAPIDVWLSPEDHLIHMVSLTVPSSFPGGGEQDIGTIAIGDVQVDFRYSGFHRTSIMIPTVE